MTKLIFNAIEVRRVVEHSLRKPQRKMLVDWDEKKGEGIYKLPDAPAVLFVHDQGVYLMSNGEPRDIVKGESSFCAYARGCDPNKDREWWDTARDLVGGDDFGETLPWAEEIKTMIDSGASQIVIECKGRNFFDLLGEQSEFVRECCSI